jgi:hypothetical protein
MGNHRPYFDEAAAQTAAQVTEKYLGTLAAVDVFARDNAYSIFEFALREDAGMWAPSASAANKVDEPRVALDLRGPTPLRLPSKTLVGHRANELRTRNRVGGACF